MNPAHPPGFAHKFSAEREGGLSRAVKDRGTLQGAAPLTDSRALGTVYNSGFEEKLQFSRVYGLHAPQ